MLKLELYNPVNYVFGKGQMAKLIDLVPTNTEITGLLGKYLQNGIYDQ